MLRLIFGLLIIRFLTLAASVMLLAVINVSNIQQPSIENLPKTSIPSAE